MYRFLTSEILQSTKHKAQNAKKENIVAKQNNIFTKHKAQRIRDPSVDLDKRLRLCRQPTWEMRK